MTLLHLQEFQSLASALLQRVTGVYREDSAFVLHKTHRSLFGEVRGVRGTKADETLDRGGTAWYAWKRCSSTEKSVRLMGTKHTKESKPPKRNTPTLLLELPLVVEAGQAKRLRAHLEAGRQFYNAVLSEGQKRLHRMKADPPGRRRGPFSVPTNRRGRQPSLRCANTMAFPNMPFMASPKHCGSVGWPTTLMPCWLSD